MFKAIRQLVLGTLLSKAVGLLREVLFASWFGTSDVAAAFRISQAAFLVPVQALVGDTLGGGALPLYRGWLKDEPAKAKALVVAALIQGALIGFIIWIVLFFYPLSVVDWMAPGVTATARLQAAAMVQVMSFAVPAYILGNSLGYIDAAHGRYAALSSRSTLVNVGAIAAAGIAVLTKDSNWLAVGTCVSYVAFFVWTVIEFLRHQRRTVPSGPISPHLVEVTRSLWRNTASLLAIPVITQGYTVVERVVASWLGTSVVPGLDYARYISDTTIVLTAVPLGIVTLASYGGSRSEETKEHSRLVASLLMLFSFPLGTFLFANAFDIVRVLYARGAFDEHSVTVTGSVLAGASVGLGGTVTAYFLIKALNAQVRNVEAVMIVGSGAIANIVFDLLTWKSLGPLALGLGNGANGLTMLLIALARHGLLRQVGPLIGWLIVGCAGMVALHWPIGYLPIPLVRLMSFCILCAAWWGSLYILARPLRRAAEPVRDKLMSYIRRKKGAA